MTYEVEISPQGRPDAALDDRSAAASRRVDPRPLWATIATLGGATAWFVVSSAGWLDADTFPSPGTVVATGRGLVTSGRLAASVGQSLHEVAWGLSWGTVLGVVAAGIVATVCLLTHRDVFIDTVVRVAPIGGVLILGVTWFTRATTTPIGIIALSTSIPIGLHTLVAWRAASRGVSSAGHAVPHPLQPDARRAVVTGLCVGARVATSAAWATLALITTVGAAPGLDTLDLRGASDPTTAELVVRLVVIAMLAVTSEIAVQLATGRVLAWRTSRLPVDIAALERATAVSPARLSDADAETVAPDTRRSGAAA